MVQVEKIHVFLATLLVLAAPLQSAAQISDSVEVWKSFYPLGIGDRWEYNAFPSGGQSPDPERATPRVVEGDTLMANQLLYSVVIEGDRDGWSTITYERVDTVLMAVMRYDPDAVTPSHFNDEYPFLLLPNGDASRSLEPGEGWDEYRLRCLWAPTRDVLGRQYRMWACGASQGERTTFHNYEVYLAERVGPQFLADVWGSGVFNYRNLNYVRNSYLESGIQVDVEQLPTPGADKLEIYPNPVVAGSPIQVRGDRVASCTRVAIVDVAGRSIASEVIARSQTQMSIALLSGPGSGLYLGRLECHAANHSFTFVVIPN